MVHEERLTNVCSATLFEPHLMCMRPAALLPFYNVLLMQSDKLDGRNYVLTSSLSK